MAKTYSLDGVNLDNQALLTRDSQLENMVDKEKDVLEYMNRPATIQCFCKKWKTTVAIKNRVYSFFLLFLMAARIGTAIITDNFVGAMGETVVNAKTTTDNIYNYVSFLETILISGLTARIAQARGHNDHVKMRDYILLGMVGSLLYGAVAGGLLLSLREPIFKSIGQPQLDSAGTLYYILSGVALPFAFVENACMGIMLGLYDLVVFTLMILVSTTVYILGTFITLKVLNLGLFSVSLMNLVSDSLLLIMMVVYFLSNRVQKKYSFKLFPGSFPHGNDILLFVQDNGYLIVYDSLSSLSALLLVPFALRLGPAQETAISVFNSMIDLTTQIARGFGLSLTMFGSILVARGRIDIFIRIFKSLFIMIVVFSLAFTIAMSAAPSNVQDFFYHSSEDSQKVIFQLNSVWWVGAAFHPIMAISILFESVIFSFTKFKFSAGTAVFSIVVGYVPLVVAGIWNKSLFMLTLSLPTYQAIKSIIFGVYMYLFLLSEEQNT